MGGVERYVVGKRELVRGILVIEGVVGDRV